MSSKVLGRENLLDWEVVPAMKPNCASPLIIAFGGEDVIAIWIENMIKLQVPAKSFVLFFFFTFLVFQLFLLGTASHPPLNIMHQKGLLVFFWWAKKVLLVTPSVSKFW